MTAHELATLTINEYVSDHLDGEATIQDCMAWCRKRRKRGYKVPRRVIRAVRLVELLRAVEETFRVERR